MLLASTEVERVIRNIEHSDNPLQDAIAQWGILLKLELDPELTGPLNSLLFSNRRTQRCPHDFTLIHHVFGISTPALLGLSMEKANPLQDSKMTWEAFFPGQHAFTVSAKEIAILAFLLIAVSLLVLRRQRSLTQEKDSASLKLSPAEASRHSRVYYVVAVVRAVKMGELEQDAETKKLTEPLAERIFDTAGWMWYGTSDEWVGAGLEQTLSGLVEGEERGGGAFDVHLFRVGLPASIPELSSRSQLTARRRAFCELGRKGCEFVVSRRLPKEVLEGKGFFES